MENPEKKVSNHFTVSIPKSREELYTQVKSLRDELGCKTADLVWYGLELALAPGNKPKAFGLQLPGKKGT
jgi:hypothetical protein